MLRKNLIRVFTLLLAVLTVLSFASCAAQPVDSTLPESTNAPTTVPDETKEETPDATLPIRVSVLNGTTGFGAAKLMNDKKEGKAALDYAFSVETDASVITAGLIKGDIDIAALPTNAASVLYNKTKGDVRVLALITLGVLYIVENGNSVTSLAALEGKTVYCPAQNPAFIFEAICKAAKVNVTIDTTYAQPAALMSAVAASEAGMIAVLPQPVLTVAMSKNANLRIALDLTAEWKNAVGSDSLVQSCLVVRKAFLEEHPAEVGKFLDDFRDSIAFLNEKPDEAAQMTVDLGIYAGAAAVAAKAIPACNIVYLDGAEMKNALSSFLSTMFSYNPASVGGALPGDDFYYARAGK